MTEPVLSGSRVVLAALVSAKDKGFEERLVSLHAALAERGAIIVAQLVQRRGVSRGGVGRMLAPMNASTLLGTGKVRELAELARVNRADTIVFLNELTGTQVRNLEGETQCRVIDTSSL